MKDLILVRHAKSSWEYSVKDEDRPLKEKGVERALKISKLLKEKLPFNPELWISSYANRALHTASIFAKEFNALDQLQINSNLYIFSNNELVRLVKGLDNEFNSAILFGHNEAITEFANSLGTKNVSNIPTAGVVYIRFNSLSWADVSEGETEFILIPKKIK